MNMERSSGKLFFSGQWLHVEEQRQCPESATFVNYCTKFAASALYACTMKRYHSKITNKCALFHLYLIDVEELDCQVE